MTATAALAPTEPTPATTSASDTEAGAPQGHIGRIVIETGHNIQLEHPDVVIREVSTLLARCTEGEKQPCTS
jgi:pimeloyl-ACP methyl ester carboxylesterase